MNTDSNAATGRGDGPGHTIEVADATFIFRSLLVADPKPTGAQLAAAAGHNPGQQIAVLRIVADGELKDIRSDEIVDLDGTQDRFVIVESGSGYLFTIDDERFDWPSRIVSGGLLRKLGRVPPERDIYLELKDEVERLIQKHDLVDLASPGVERFKTQERHWKLNVQGVVLTLHHPTIVVRQAIKDAGFDPNTGWIVVLRVRGEPKREVGLDYVVDLRTPGIEKLRLTPKDVNNGEAVARPRRAFALLEVDERYLDSRAFWWETILDGGRRWLLIRAFPVLMGFTIDHVTLALEIPLTYPGAQIDMFYTNPKLVLRSGRVIECIDAVMPILGTAFSRWSRHRGPASPWNPATDNIATHLALVESAMAKESGE
jgi:hypothetical protein